MAACSPVRPLVDAHFAGTISPRGERSLRDHLPTCAACRGYYERHLVLASLDPRSLRPEDRMAIGLGFSPRRVADRAWTTIGAAAAAAAIALAVLPGRAPAEFTARGAPSPASPSFFAYRIGPDARLNAQGSTIRANDDLAFAYANPGGVRRLLVYGVDEHRHVYWYYPAWSDPTDDPHAIGLDRSETLRELPEAIRHGIDGVRLTIHAVFLDEDVSVREVERWLADPRTSDEPLPSTVYEERLTLAVEH
jgi:hypothetical protein